MRVLDLFSGIGGFSLGLERAGMETVAFCENDKKAQLVLKKHWPDVPIFDDVRTLNAEQLRHLYQIDLICGGFPCQPFSQAGKRKGKEDDRHLWPEYFRLIQEIRPRWVIGENVAGLINMGLDDVLSDLESEAYSCQTLVIPACAINAPHRRDRVWIIAHSGLFGQKEHEEQATGVEQCGEETNVENPGRALRQRAKFQGEDANEVGQGDANQHQRSGSTPGDDVAYANDIPSEGIKTTSNNGKDRSQPNDQFITGCGNEGGWWAVEPNVGRVAHGIPNRVDRLKQLGNAVVPQIPEIIGRAIMQIHNKPKCWANTSFY